MEHIKAIIIKFLSCFILLYVILGLVYRLTFADIFLISLVLGGITYALGDMIILPRTNNITASIADFGLAIMIIWLLSENVTDGENLFTMSLVAAFAVTVFEYFFHKYIAHNVIDEDKEVSNRPRNLEYQTEISEELTLQKSDDRD